MICLVWERLLKEVVHGKEIRITNLHTFAVNLNFSVDNETRTAAVRVNKQWA